MSVVLMIYSRSACREFVLPAVRNEEFVVSISSAVFDLRQDAALHMEENRGSWYFLPDESYAIYGVDDAIQAGDAVRGDEKRKTLKLIDGANYLTGEHIGRIVDNTHGVMLEPEDTLTNNGTKGNPCLIADLFGDFREEILLRTRDSSAIRIYMNTDITAHKLFTLLHDTQYRVGVAWQNNCYNQPCYPSFYLASDMDWADVIPGLEKKE